MGQEKRGRFRTVGGCAGSGPQFHREDEVLSKEYFLARGILLIKFRFRNFLPLGPEEIAWR